MNLKPDEQDDILRQIDKSIIAVEVLQKAASRESGIYYQGYKDALVWVKDTYTRLVS